MFDNRYFEFDEPIHWFRRIGSSASNTFVGRSQVFDPVFRLTTIEPGDQVHALVGGTFLVRTDGRVEEGRFWLPKHIFERSYGPRDTDAMFLSRVAATGRCREIPAEKAFKADYGKLVEKGYPKLPPRMGHLDRIDKTPPSPMLMNLIRADEEAGLTEAVKSAGGKATWLEVGNEPESAECSLRIDMPGKQKVSISASPDSATVWVRDWNKAFGIALRAACEGGLGISPDFRNDVVTLIPERQAVEAMHAVRSYVVEGHVPVPASDARP